MIFGFTTGCSSNDEQYFCLWSDFKFYDVIFYVKNNIVYTLSWKLVDYLHIKSFVSTDEIFSKCLMFFPCLIFDILTKRVLLIMNVLKVAMANANELLASLVSVCFK